MRGVTRFETLRNPPFKFLLTIVLVFLTSKTVYSKVNPAELTQKSAENSIRHIIEPLLDKYCRDQCKLMNVNVSVDLATADALSPGFDEIESRKENELAPSSARAKMLIDDKVGPVSRGKLLDLIQQYLDTLDYPVKIDTQITHFPLPQGSERRVAELKERVSKQFLATTDEIIRQFCPQQCLLADYDIQTDIVNAEEAQYGSPGEFIQDGDTALKIKEISASILMDTTLTKEEQSNVLEMVKLKTNSFKHVLLTGKTLKFPHPAEPKRGLASNSLESTLESAGGLERNSTKSNEKSNNTTTEQSKTTSSDSVNSSSTDKSNSINNNTNNTHESNLKQEKFERFEKVERVESGDAVQAELQKFKIFGLIFAASIFALLIFIALSVFKSGDSARVAPVQRLIQSQTSDPAYSNSSSTPKTYERSPPREIDPYSISKHYEIERLTEELTSVYAQQPKVAKQVFTRLLTEEGVEATCQCIHIFGEGIAVDMLKDSSLQSELTELLDYYAKNPIDLTAEEKLNLLKKLHSRTIAGKMLILGGRSSSLFDFLSEMDGLQILELIRTESLTVKSIVLTQCDTQKRSIVYAHMDPDIRIQLLSELTRIDYLPRDFIFNVATALKRKKKENPRLNTEALPGSEVLVSLLERTGQELQRTVVKTLEANNPDSARTVKSKLVSVDTLRYLRDGQLLEVVLSLKHEELIQFLKGVPLEIKKTIFAKSPQELTVELEEELAQITTVSREIYQTVERKIINKIKLMANESQINLIETNDRMFSDSSNNTGFIETNAGESPDKRSQIKKVAGW